MVSNPDADPDIQCLQELRDHKSHLTQSPLMKAHLERRFAHRRKILKEACNQFGNKQFPPHIKRSLTYGHKTSQPRYSMCMIPKIGSAFWRQVNTAYRKTVHKSVTKEAYDISIEYDRGSALKLSNTMLTFVRDPYMRLFSGYVDKLFYINPSFWNTLGRSVIRYNASHTKSSRGGHEVTFAELVNYVIYCHENKKDIDSHFKPISQHCRFCEIDYTYIGKMETFKDDVVYMGDVMGMLNSTTIGESILKYCFHGRSETIYRLGRLVFYETRGAMERSGVSLIEGLRRTWKTWQIRGIISIELPFPLRANDTNITFERFNDLAQKAYKASKPSILQEARDRALRQAYSSLTYDTKVRLMREFEPEFKMFEYDPMPDFVFGEYRNEENIDLFS
ncbi:carbohydrate sulfotransferase 12-like [Haliotis asinina]|uniref:carbohydrate sulfotransferase 12-like n=1 Tax=Haliotis asinina TaxID=109174 RepID=UPI003532041F